MNNDEIKQQSNAAPTKMYIYFDLLSCCIVNVIVIQI